jgi:iron complex outermembrane receptor protein
MKRSAWVLAIFAWALAASGQFTLTGTAVDEENRPLPGANLVIRELDRGSVSSGDGTFKFTEVPGGSYTLEITFLGYEKGSFQITLDADLDLGRISMVPAPLMVEEVMVTAVRAGEKSPVAFVNLDREEIRARNLGQDIPYLLSMTPSLVTSSDAGNGIGYTSMRIRGTDANRINVTINGVPLNDAESHSVYWVDLPDIASSVEQIQVQRGVGTSTNGAPAFGASVNLQTRNVAKVPYASYEGALGSFGTYRSALSAGTGILGDHFSFDLRLSDMHSNGYIDRSWTDLQSYYASAGYMDHRTLVKFITFAGTEELYQAWGGVPSDILDTRRTYNGLGEYTDAEGNTAYYDRQVDHYRQDHYQLHLTREIRERLYAHAALHYTRGKGYYEQYEEDQAFSDYLLEDVITGGDTIRETDLIRRKWLDNDFYGFVGGIHFRGRVIETVLGGGWNRYAGDHFGTVIWARVAGESEIRHRWYDNTGVKSDWNSYLKTTVQATERLTFFADLQLRGINYSINGTDDDLRDLAQEHDFFFFNPKGGADFRVDAGQRIYLYVARANREPNRDNFTDADPARPMPVPETLMDYEGGYAYTGRDASFNANLYFMDYTDQLVLTGEINDVGNAVMTNVKDSYRAGIEMSAGVRFFSWLKWDVNGTFSSNKIRNYVGYVDNWSWWEDPEHEPYQVIEELGTTDLSFSPGIIANSRLDVEPLENLHLELLSRFVGRQFIDNTSSRDRFLDPYFIQDVRISWSIFPQFIRECSLHLQLMNLFNREYETNAWIYRYYYDGAEGFLDGYYPQAGFHFMAGLSLRF